MGSHGAGSSDDIAVPFGRIQEISAKYNLTVRTSHDDVGRGHACDRTRFPEGHMNQNIAV